MLSVSVFVLQCELFSIRDALVAWQIGMDANKFAEEAFRMDSRIRYVGIVDRQFNVLVSRMREGVASITPEEDDRHFVQLIPPILLDAVEKLTPLLGIVESVTVRYEKVLLVFFTKGNYVVVLSFSSTVTRPFMSALTGKMLSLASEYLTD